MRIDHQTHWLPRPCLDALRGRDRLPRSERRGDRYQLEIAPGGSILDVTPEHDDLDVQLATADANGIDVMVTSSPPLAEVLHLPGAEAEDILSGVNAAMADAQREHAGRVIGLALLPWQDPERALRVLDHAVRRLDLRGVFAPASIDGRPLVDDGTMAVFRRIEELDVPMFLHPTVRSSTYQGRHLRRSESGVGWMYHTALAALGLVDGGVLERCPRLVVVHPHLGGVLPYVVGRVDRMEPDRASRSLAASLRTRFYTDTVGATPGALRFALDTYGPERVLFATDYPHVSMAAGRAYVDSEIGDRAPALYANRLPNLRLDSERVPTPETIS